MESYVKLDGRLKESGKTQVQLESAPWYNSTDFGLSDTSQTFDDMEVRIRNREVWHYVPTENLYFQTDRDSHGLVKAMATLFLAPRWEEIYHNLEDYGLYHCLERWDLPRLRQKINRLYTKVLISAGEESDLQNILTGYGV